MYLITSREFRVAGNLNGVEYSRRRGGGPWKTIKSRPRGHGRRIDAPGVYKISDSKALHSQSQVELCSVCLAREQPWRRPTPRFASCSHYFAYIWQVSCLRMPSFNSRVTVALVFRFKLCEPKGFKFYTRKNDLFQLYIFCYQEFWQLGPREKKKIAHQFCESKSWNVSIL